MKHDSNTWQQAAAAMNEGTTVHQSPDQGEVSGSVPDLLSKRFITVIGKGGVGKSTVAAALAALAARRGLRVLLAAVQAKDRLGDLLGCGPIGPKNRAVWPGVEAVNMVPEVNLEEYALMTLKFRVLYRLVLGNQIVQSLMAGVPGLYQWSLLGKATYHALELNPDGSQRYDLVILDAPATGHGVELLRVPLTIAEAITAGPLRAEALERWEMLVDAAQHEVLPVTLAEELAVTETGELVERLEELGMSVRRVIVNGKFNTLFQAGDEANLRRLSLPEGAQEILAAGRTRLSWEKLQARQQQRLEALVPYPQVELPRLLGASMSMGPDAVRQLSDLLEAGLAATGPRNSGQGASG
jgi:anion-transporting  ArsA/GET3 family ATPase